MFPGFQSNVKAWLSAFDIFVLPSLMEGTPMALLEAMAHGLPVIASYVGGIPGIIRSEENGILIPAANEQELARAICNICENERLKNKLATEAKRTISENYDINDWTKKIEYEYLKLLIKDQLN